MSGLRIDHVPNRHLATDAPAGARTRRRRYRLAGVLPGPLVPATVLLVALLVAPLVLLFSFAFLQVDRGVVTGGFTTEAYADILGDSFFWYLFGRTFIIALLVTGLCLLFGYPIAWLYVRTSGWKRTFILLAVAAPLLTSALVRTFAWIVLLGGSGAVNDTIQGLGLSDGPVRFLFDVKGVVIGMTQVLLPFMVVPLVSALQDVPGDSEDAAKNLGASAIRTFWAVTLPQTLPGMAAGVTLVFVLAYSDFTVAVLLGGGAFNFASVYIFEAMTTLLDWSRGAAISSLLLVSSLVFVTLFNVWARRMTRWSRMEV